MLQQIKLFYEKHIALPAPEEINEKHTHIACAALFVEMMSIDNKLSDEEREIILKRVIKMFSLSVDEANTLISLATEQKNQATDYFQFTSLINKSFTQEQKVVLIKTMWQIAYADGQLDKYEEALVRKIADLLHVPHLDFIKTKIQVSG